ncbi:MAG: helix-turn-helix transcriptional regulator [Erysipelotrichaceae bacterium]|nr:helix-turn-helix transcriptional regulator [Erysipelotrichaceae bacterium]
MTTSIIVNPNKLNMAMANACLNAYEVCEKANVSYSSFQSMTRNKSVKPKTVGKIAKALNCKVEDLI